MEILLYFEELSRNCFMYKFLRLFKKTFPNFVMATFLLEIEKHLEGCKNILDVGCGNNSPIGLLDKKYNTIGIDGYKPSVEESKKSKIHNAYILGDIRKLNSLVKKKSFDAVIALDVIEHLKKKDGYRLLASMERASRKRVILVTPNGFVPQYNKDNRLQAHLSGWNIEDFAKAGYIAEGIYGTKLCNVFRNDEAQLRYQPKVVWTFIWGLLVEITHHLYTKKHPTHSIALLAVKKIS